jgi:hypothetical protein
MKEDFLKAQRALQEITNKFNSLKTGAEKRLGVANQTIALLKKTRQDEVFMLETRV